MADPKRQLLLVALALGLLGGAGAVLCGAGSQNGDVAAYVAQALAGDLSQRMVHLGYLALASALAGWSDDLGRSLDFLSVGSAAVAALGVAWISRESRVDVAAVGAAAVLLPVACFAEVDPLWIALVVGARASTGPLSAGCFGLAVAVSPVALLAGPWVAWGDRGRWRWLLGAAVLSVLALTVASHGGWWIGDRGVLSAPVPRVWRALQAWGTPLPWALLPLALVAPRRDEGEILTWAPLLLAPPDVPVWILPGLTLALRAARGVDQVPGAVVAVLVAVQVAIGGFMAVDRRAEIRAENRLVADVASQLTAGDRLIAPFTFGARVSVAVTADPYGLCWRPPGEFLRDQRQCWCGSAPDRVVQIADGQVLWLDPKDPQVLAGCGEP